MSEANAKFLPIIMAGGAGTRLWPLSREALPKQFIGLSGDGRSTFQATLERVSGSDFAPPIVVTGSDFRFIAAEQMQASGVEGRIVLEPARRDSAAAVAVGALLGAREDPAQICLVLAADHVIPDAAAFAADCRRAAEAAGQGRIMTLGIVPAGASSAYGYIEKGAGLGVEGAFAVLRFVEKPDSATAAAYVEAGMLWNSGNFLFPAQLMLDELAANAPEVLSAASQALEGAARDLDFVRLEEAAFARAPKVSIDYAVMEKTDRAGVVAASFAWSDVGAWDALHAISRADGEGNVIEGPVLATATHNSLVRSEGTLTAVVGMDNVVVVATPDAVLVAAKDQAAKVKDVVAALARQGRREASEHLRVHRPWGWYQRIDIGERFQVKQIYVKPGAALSLQRHFHRAEHWVVVQGTAEVTVDDTVRIVHENEAAYLPIGCVHRMRNPGKIALKIIEVQVGSYTGEDDIIRIEDVYARS
jgi:mannose-1-phosphate guanylyltransferase / mannose-6-phosphate isomerase